MAHEHTQVPENPRDGDVSVCACGVSHAFVELDDGLPGEWVDTTPPDPPACTPEYAATDPVTSISAAIDGTYPLDLAIEAWLWRRIAKITEENGEVTQALLGTLGENPRKGVTHTLDDVCKELLDVAVAALGAWAHVNHNEGSPLDAVADHARFVDERLHAAIESHRVSSRPEGER